MLASEALEALDEELWIASRPLPLWVGDVGTRMTVMRLVGGDLLLHSPVSLDPALRGALDRIGRVRWVVGPSRVHHLFLGDYASAYPSAELWGAPDLAFNVQPGAKNRAKVFHWLVGANGRFGPHRIIRAVLRDHEAARGSLAKLLEWDFDRIIVTHGDVLEHGGREALRAAFSFLRPE